MVWKSESGNSARKLNLVMKTYLITYRIKESENGEERDFGPLYATIQSLDAFAKPMDSVWIISTALTAQELYAKLARFFNDEDQLLVVECGGFAEWHGIPADTSMWLEDTFISSEWLDQAFSPAGRPVPRRWSP